MRIFRVSIVLGLIMLFSFFAFAETKNKTFTKEERRR